MDNTVFLASTYQARGIKVTSDLSDWLRRASQRAPTPTGSLSSDQQQKLRAEYNQAVFDRVIATSKNANGGPVLWIGVGLPIIHGKKPDAVAAAAAAAAAVASSSSTTTNTTAVSGTTTTSASSPSPQILAQERSMLIRQLTMLVPADLASKINLFFQLQIDPKFNNSQSQNQQKHHQLQSYKQINAGDVQKQFLVWVKSQPQQQQQQQPKQQQPTSILNASTTLAPSSSQSFILSPPPSTTTTSNNNNGNGNGNGSLLMLPSLLQQRRQRENNNNTSNNTNNNQSSNNTVVGTSHALEREFTRTELSADILRPLSILKLAKQHILKKFFETPEFQKHPVEALSWLFRQLKGMRQDVRAQNLDSIPNDEFAVSVYELHAKVSLLLGDLSEYIQCQAALKNLHDEKNLCTSSAEVEEFTIYRLVSLALGGQDEVVAQEIRHLNVMNEKLLAMSHYVVDGVINEFLTTIGTPNNNHLVATLKQKLGLQSESSLKTLDEVKIFLIFSCFSSSMLATTENNNNNSSSATILQKMKDLLPRNKNNNYESFISQFGNNNNQKQSLIENATMDEKFFTHPSFVLKLPKVHDVDDDSETATTNNSSSILNSSTRMNSITTLAALMNRPAMKILVSNALPQLQRGDGKGFLKSILEIHNNMNKSVKRQTTATTTMSSSAFPSLLHLVRIYLVRIRIKWLLYFCRSVKAAGMKLPTSIIMEILGFSTNVDQVIHESLGVASKFHSHQMQVQHQKKHPPHPNEPKLKNFSSPAHQNWCQLFDEIKCPSASDAFGVSSSQHNTIDFDLLANAVTEYTKSLGTGTLVNPQQTQQ